MPADETAPTPRTPERGMETVVVPWNGRPPKEHEGAPAHQLEDSHGHVHEALFEDGSWFFFGVREWIISRRITKEYTYHAPLYPRLATPAPAASAPAGEDRETLSRALCTVLELDPDAKVKGITGHWWKQWEQVAIHSLPKFLEALPAAEPRARAEGEAMREACIAIVLRDGDKNSAHIVAERIRDEIPALPARDEARPDAGTGVVGLEGRS